MFRISTSTVNLDVAAGAMSGQVSWSKRVEAYQKRFGKRYWKRDIWHSMPRKTMGSTLWKSQTMMQPSFLARVARPRTFVTADLSQRIPSEVARFSWAKIPQGPWRPCQVTDPFASLLLPKRICAGKDCQGGRGSQKMNFTSDVSFFLSSSSCCCCCCGCGCGCGCGRGFVSTPVCGPEMP